MQSDAKAQYLSVCHTPVLCQNGLTSWWNSCISW